MRKRSPRQPGKAQHRVLHPTDAQDTSTINLNEIRVQWVVYKDEPSSLGNILPLALMEN